LNNADLFAAHQGKFEADLGVEHHFSDGLYAKRMRIPAGFVAGTHAHNYSHLSILAKGRVILRTNEGQKEYTAPACLEIKSGVHHTIEALEDCEWFCIHATDETDATKVDEVLIRKETSCH
jgi:quercetin dioxygenase-like cupin family protein